MCLVFVSSLRHSEERSDAGISLDCHESIDSRNDAVVRGYRENQPPITKVW